MKLVNRIEIIVFGLIVIAECTCFAFETKTHETIIQRVAIGNFDDFSLDTFLKEELGLEFGIQQGISVDQNNIRTFLEQITKGGTYEDDPPKFELKCPRSINHFHNPIDDSGFSGIWGINWICDGESSILWSQMSRYTQSPGGWYSWHDARDYYYLALTKTNKLERESFYGDAFRALGQLMHLLQDLSVPEHARDDGHYLAAYEKWITENDPYLNIESFEPVSFDKTILINNSEFSSFVPIEKLFDTNEYTGANPEITKTVVDPENQKPLPQTVGLSEYTNANFITPDTAFNEFDYPSLQDTELFCDPSNTRLYLRSSDSAPGDPVEHLATVSHLYHWRTTYFPDDKENLLWDLDPLCYQDYAELLIPRAIGYSANLLEYFFRGRIDLFSDPEGGSGYIIDNISEEEMEGKFELYYDNENDERMSVVNGDIPAVLTIAAGEQSDPLYFSLPGDTKDPAKFTLVFRGRLGAEEDAVVGKVVDLRAAIIELRLSYLSLLIDPETGGLMKDVVDDDSYHVTDTDWPIRTNLLDGWRSKHTEMYIEASDKAIKFEQYSWPGEPVTGLECSSGCSDQLPACPATYHRDEPSLHWPDKTDTFHSVIEEKCSSTSSRPPYEETTICTENCDANYRCAEAYGLFRIKSHNETETWSNNKKIADSFYHPEINGVEITAFNHYRSISSYEEEMQLGMDCYCYSNCRYNGESDQYYSWESTQYEEWQTPWGTILPGTIAAASARNATGSGCIVPGGAPHYQNCFGGHLIQEDGYLTKDQRKIFRALQWEDIIIIVFALEYQTNRAELESYTSDGLESCRYGRSYRQPYSRDAIVVVAKRPDDYDTVDPTKLPASEIASTAMEKMIDVYTGKSISNIRDINTGFSIRIWK